MDTFQIVCTTRRKCDRGCIKQVGTVDSDPEEPAVETDLFPTKLWKTKDLRPFLDTKAFGCFTLEGEEIAWVEAFDCACGKASVRVIGSAGGRSRPDGLDDLPPCFVE
ncbi:MAG TPA: hypothetical protein VHW93_12090 [Acidimicrobiales bacterium]|nr:hypothetical protein [Acidimicrobiales bacterium]